MFTGIVEEIGTAVRVEPRALTVSARKVLDDVKEGDSIAVNGVCLTVTAFSAKHFSVGLMPETLRRSNLGFLRPGDPVNLERALAVGSRLGGHFVQGHVDGLGKVASMHKEDVAIFVRFLAEPEILRYIVEKGFIAVDGVSLTVVNCDHESFSVSLVGYTQGAIILTRKTPGYVANLEVDILGKYVEKLVGGSKQPRPLTEEFLAEHGYL
ncbi:MAG: riboflavin synthase [Chloroflexi bacterium]|nr:riboflavin synthase [Chloroflexota bacterium]